MLLGVVLSDIESEFSGNLMVWPGSHLLLHKYVLNLLLHISELRNTDVRLAKKVLWMRPS